MKKVKMTRREGCRKCDAWKWLRKKGSWNRSVKEDAQRTRILGEIKLKMQDVMKAKKGRVKVKKMIKIKKIWVRRRRKKIDWKNLRCSYLISYVLSWVEKKLERLQLLSGEHFLFEKYSEIAHTFSNMARDSLLRYMKKGGKEGRKGRQGETIINKGKWLQKK